MFDTFVKDAVKFLFLKIAEPNLFEPSVGFLFI